MTALDSQLQVRQHPPGSPEHVRGLNLALCGPDAVCDRPSIPAANLMAYAERRGASLDLLFGAYVAERLVGACVAVVAPGGGGMVFGSLDSQDPVRRRATEAALTALRRAAWRSPISLLEVLLLPEDNASGPLLQRAGFRFLTRLIYMGRPTEAPLPPRRPDPPGEWLTYTPERAGLFCAALDASYAESLDCPELRGLRDTPDVLAGHRATGVHDPSLWWVVRRGARPAAILLLTRIPVDASLEIVYMGVAQPARRQGFGDALLARAVSAARSESATTLSVAVDVANGPARRLYERWSFVETGKRDAWIASPDRS